jgi:hypothetical protein
MCSECVGPEIRMIRLLHIPACICTVYMSMCSNIPKCLLCMLYNFYISKCKRLSQHVLWPLTDYINMCMHVCFHHVFLMYVLTLFLVINVGFKSSKELVLLCNIYICTAINKLELQLVHILNFACLLDLTNDNSWFHLIIALDITPVSCGLKIQDKIIVTFVL